MITSQLSLTSSTLTAFFQKASTSNGGTLSAMAGSRQTTVQASITGTVDTVSLSQEALNRNQADKALSLLRQLSSFLAQVPRGGGSDLARSLFDLVQTNPGLTVEVHANNATIKGSARDDRLSAYNDATIEGEAGNDRISAYHGANLSGGDGDDYLDAYNDSTLDGGDGNDSLSAYNNANLSGGAGNDRLDAYNDSTLDGGDGDDVLRAANNSRLSGGDGNDSLRAYRDSVLDGGAGDDEIRITHGGTIDGGDGNDTILTGEGTVADGGSGDDRIRMSDNATIRGGTGNDLIDASNAKGGSIHFKAGDGQDVIELGRLTHANLAYSKSQTIATDGTTTVVSQSESLTYNAQVAQGSISDTRLVFEDISAEDAIIERQGSDVVISFQNSADSVTLRNVRAGGLPTIEFQGGETLKIADYFGGRGA